MIHDEGNPLLNNYNDCKVQISTISNNLKKSRKYLIFSAIVSGLLGGVYSAVFYMIHFKGFPFLFTVINYVNFSALFLNVMFGLFTVLKSSEKYALFYYVSTLTIFRISIIYQFVRLVLIFMDYFDSLSDEPYYINLVKVFAIVSLIVSLILYYFVTIWAKFYFLILKTYVSIYNRILNLESILKIAPSFLQQFDSKIQSESPTERESLGRNSYIPITNQDK
jgi:hypothetical protein